MAKEQYATLDTSEERDDLGLAIQNLITQNLKNLNTCFLAEIVAINQNKVSVKQVIKSASSEADLIVNNCLVAFPFSNAWQMQFKLKIGDIGLCLVCNKDISTYKQSGVSSIASTKRFKSVNDSVYLPLSMFKSLANDSVDFTIKGTDGDEFTFDNGELTINANADIKANAGGGLNAEATSEIQLKAPTTKIESPAIALNGNVTLSGAMSSGASPMSAGNDSGTLGACFEAVFSALDLIASGMKGSQTAPTAYNAGKDALKAQIKGVVA